MSSIMYLPPLTSEGYLLVNLFSKLYVIFIMHPTSLKLVGGGGVGGGGAYCFWVVRPSVRLSRF